MEHQRWAATALLAGASGVAAIVAVRECGTRPRSRTLPASSSSSSSSSSWPSDEVWGSRTLPALQLDIAAAERALRVEAAAAAAGALAAPPGGHADLAAPSALSHWAGKTMPAAEPARGGTEAGAVYWQPQGGGVERPLGGAEREGGNGVGGRKVAEWLGRAELLFGMEAMLQLRGAHVLVVRVMDV
jgi:hypothetical protein